MSERRMNRREGLLCQKKEKRKYFGLTFGFNDGQKFVEIDFKKTQKDNKVNDVLRGCVLNNESDEERSAVFSHQKAQSVNIFGIHRRVLREVIVFVVMTMFDNN
jgi:hypothetical protein